MGGGGTGGGAASSERRCWSRTSISRSNVDVRWRWINKTVRRQGPLLWEKAEVVAVSATIDDEEDEIEGNRRQGERK